jgi:hypothetical protein
VHEQETDARPEIANPIPPITAAALDATGGQPHGIADGNLRYWITTPAVRNSPKAMARKSAGSPGP